MGILLIVSQVIIIMLFLAWAYYQKDAMNTSVDSMASGALTGRKKKEKGKKKEGKLKVGEDLDVLGFEGSGDQVGNPMQGEAGEIEMKGVDKKHLLQASGFNALGKTKSGKGATGPRMKNKTKYEYDEDYVVGPPASGLARYYYQHSDGVTSTWEKPDELK
ncbi:hypothetical protein TL16_g09042 [Triparma laevis f. inornata]|uniref:Uncharacterized protein n=2 Tax=Triparma laevis TaxID=1534972 RepID=A0A9W7E8X8_9STRA|nr:hypothetical protein TrLO_g4980 [Triparma laevis f. longispina]GMH81781.1 hypothetical protein TL16_g09042 [Triparma laevis f. inornata]